jgi:peptide/nickel transport system permease protein
MGRLILNRLAIAIPVIFLTSGLAFFLVSLIPGDAATVILGQDATPERIAALNEQLGLNEPFFVQYANWLGALFRGDLGVSLYTGDAVLKTISQRIWPTFWIAAFATFFAAVVGVALGTWAAVRKGVAARVSDFIAMLGISLPNYWIALLLIVLVAGQLRLLPSIGYVSPTEDFGEWVSHLVLPVTALAVAGVAIIAKQTHDSVAAALSRDFMRFMQANGIPRFSLIFKHGLRYAAIPIISSITGCFVNLFGGTVALETVFAIPGLGQMVETSTIRHDIAVIQGAVLAYTIVIIITMIVSDVLYGALNPKVRAAR